MTERQIKLRWAKHIGIALLLLLLVSPWLADTVHLAGVLVTVFTGLFLMTADMGALERENDV